MISVSGMGQKLQLFIGSWTPESSLQWELSHLKHEQLIRPIGKQSIGAGTLRMFGVNSDIW